jgi:hypothetical protein
LRVISLRRLEPVVTAATPFVHGADSEVLWQ